MPDISQIVPLAGRLMVSTVFLLGVGMDETADKEKLEQKVSEIWAHYTVNTKEENADILVSELYFDYLRKYPMDYYVKYKCALALYDYLIVVSVRHQFEITAKEIDLVYVKCDKLLNSIIDNFVDVELKIDACMLKVKHLLLKNKFEEAKTVAFKLPANGGMQDFACLSKATQIACDMHAWVNEHTDDKMILEDYKFFASKTTHWAFSFSGMFENETNRFTESQEYKSCLEAINKVLKK